MPAAADGLLRAIRARTDSSTGSWLNEAIARAGGAGRNDLLTLYTSMSSRLGSQPLEPASEEALDLGMPLRSWTLTDAARLALLLTRAAVPATAALFADDAIACYEFGDAGEQRSWLRGVALLPDPAHYVSLVIDGCRTNILPNFEAIACDNPYPAEHFPERNFNQLVMKALFNNVPLDRVMGLQRRANAELARMAGDFAAERRAAGRPVPGDIALVMGA